MSLPRRRFLALASAGAMPALAGCSPCGETWTGVGFEVVPLAVERDGSWRVDARLTVDFDFGRDGYGLSGAALALFDGDGAVLAESPVGELTWSAVPESQRESTDCGDHATVTRNGTLRSGTFPRWVGLRYDAFRTAFDDHPRVARYASGTPEGTVDPSDYESVVVDGVGVVEPSVDPHAPITDARFDARPLRCEAQSLEAEARTNVFLSVTGDRSVPAEHYHPRIDGISLGGDELTVSIGLETAPRFRRGDCLRTRWTLGVDVANPADMPETVTVRHLDENGDAAETGQVDVERESA